MRKSSAPYLNQRPDSSHSSAGWIAGIDSSIAPARSISRRTIAISLRSVRQPAGCNV